VAAFGLFGGLVVYLVSRSFLREQVAGVDELIGLVGRATSDLAPDGKVFVRGEYWDASADDAIASGQPVKVTAVEGLRLRVRRTESEH
jgi:membrane-bound serine protease (ClpP class)